jgi:hypothetical protein
MLCRQTQKRLQRGSVGNAASVRCAGVRCVAGEACVTGKNSVPCVACRVPCVAGRGYCNAPHAAGNAPTATHGTEGANGRRCLCTFLVSRSLLRGLRPRS